MYNAGMTKYGKRGQTPKQHTVHMRIDDTELGKWRQKADGLGLTLSGLIRVSVRLFTDSGMSDEDLVRGLAGDDWKAGA